MAVEFIGRSEEGLGTFSVLFLFWLDLLLLFVFVWFGFVGGFCGERIGLILFCFLF